MTELRAAAQQALEALRCVDLQSLVPDYGSGHYSVARLDGPQVKSAITAMEAALAEQQAEPVAWLYRGNLHPFDPSHWASDPATPLYAHPPQRPAEPVQQGCDHCNHPLYAAVKCRVCGRVTEPTPPQRKPLSGAAIYGLFVRSGLGAYHQKDFVVQTEYDRCIERFARAVERAHGIGGEE